MVKSHLLHYLTVLMRGCQFWKMTFSSAGLRYNGNQSKESYASKPLRDIRAFQAERALHMAPACSHELFQVRHDKIVDVQGALECSSEK